MTILSKLFLFFPVFHLSLIGLSLLQLFRYPSLASLAYTMAVIYLFPLGVFRVFNYFFPLREGLYDLSNKKFNPWWASHQIQYLFYTFPFLENIIRIVPGAYSLWLRLWGAKIGKGIYWTPAVIVNDRSLVDFGDNIIMGHKLEFVSHVVTPKKDKTILYVKKITIEKDCFIGAGSRFGPGVYVEKESKLPVLTDGYVNQRFKTDDYINRKT